MKDIENRDTILPRVNPARLGSFNSPIPYNPVILAPDGNSIEAPPTIQSTYSSVLKSTSEGKYFYSTYSFFQAYSKQ